MTGAPPFLLVIPAQAGIQRLSLSPRHAGA